MVEEEKAHIFGQLLFAKKQWMWKKQKLETVVSKKEKLREKQNAIREKNVFVHVCLS